MSFNPIFTITPAISASLLKIERARNYIESVQLPDACLKKMQTKILAEEAHYITRRTDLTLEQSELVLAGHQVADANPQEIQKILNYKKAFDLIDSNMTAPIQEEILRKFHKCLLEGVAEENEVPGEYKQVENYIYDFDLMKIVCFPPGPEKVPQLIKELIEWLNHEHSLNPIISAGIAQMQLKYIHPFLDGNGRIALLFSTLYLYKIGYSFKGLLSMGEYYANRSKYNKIIISLRKNNFSDFTPWLEYFIKGMAIQLQKVQKQI